MGQRQAGSSRNVVCGRQPGLRVTSSGCYLVWAWRGHRGKGLGPEPQNSQEKCDGRPREGP